MDKWSKPSFSGIYQEWANDGQKYRRTSQVWTTGKDLKRKGQKNPYI